MSAARVLAELAAVGVTLEAAGGALRYRAPAGAMTPALRAAVARVKPDLLSLLTAERRGPAGDEPAFRAFVEALEPAVISRNLPGRSYPRAPWA